MLKCAAHVFTMIIKKGNKRHTASLKDLARSTDILLFFTPCNLGRTLAFIHRAVVTFQSRPCKSI